MTPTEVAMLANSEPETRPILGHIPDCVRPKRTHEREQSMNSVAKEALDRRANERRGLCGLPVEKTPARLPVPEAKQMTADEFIGLAARLREMGAVSVTAHGMSVTFSGPVANQGSVQTRVELAVSSGKRKYSKELDDEAEAERARELDRC